MVPLLLRITEALSKSMADLTQHVVIRVHRSATVMSLAQAALHPVKSRVTTQSATRPARSRVRHVLERLVLQLVLTKNVRCLAQVLVTGYLVRRDVRRD